MKNIRKTILILYTRNLLEISNSSQFKNCDILCWNFFLKFTKHGWKIERDKCWKKIWSKWNTNSDNHRYYVEYEFLHRERQKCKVWSHRDSLTMSVTSKCYLKYRFSRDIILKKFNKRTKGNDNYSLKISYYLKYDILLEIKTGFFGF